MSLNVSTPWHEDFAWALPIHGYKDLAWALAYLGVGALHSCCQTSTWALTREWIFARDTMVEPPNGNPGPGRPCGEIWIGFQIK